MQLINNVDDFDPDYKLKEFRADCWAEDDKVFFNLELLAVDLETAEKYVQSIYPNLNTLYIVPK